MKVLAAVGGVALLTVVVVAISWMSAHNSEVALRAKFKAQQKANEASFDKVWKVIAQNAEVPQKERSSFRDTYVKIMNATKGVAGKGALASFFTQAKIDISPILFLKLMTTIESQRESFYRGQKTLLDIKAQHDQLLASFPSSVFVGGREELDAKIVTSEKTDKAFSTGQENDVKLFKD